MSARISHSLIDPILGPRLRGLYDHLRIPTWFPPEGIVLIGHGSAIVGAIGFALSLSSWSGGLIAALGVAGNHIADCVDGTHARRTGQCRNGGELLDHFTDPISFAYYFVGIGVACGRLDLTIVALICLFGLAVLTNIKAKLIGEFTLRRFGPTELKAVLTLIGVSTAGLYALSQLAGLPSLAPNWLAGKFLRGMLWGLVGLGVITLPIELVRSVREVNRKGAQPDTSEWQSR